MREIDLFLVEDLVKAALHEDMEHGDITTDLTVPADQHGTAVIISNESGICAGIAVAELAFHLLDSNVRFNRHIQDGEGFGKGRILLKIQARARAILKAERVALNILQRMCGIATLSRAFSQEIQHLPCRIVDTRKTTPGLRILEKYAVSVGGSHNHRHSLADGILIKDNHIKAAGSITEAVSRVRQGAPHSIRIQVEVTSIQELQEAISAGADAVLVDNMELEDLRKSVQMARERAPTLLVEASGGITLSNVRKVAETGVDLISTGMLTHSVKAVDLSLNFT